jgi:hypothetical protein
MPLGYMVPEELKADFDRPLLMQLVAGSFSSDGTLDDQTTTGKPEFVIAVQSGEQHIVKKVSELRGFQVLRLYEIYVEEQMNLHILITEDEKEKEAIIAQREARSSRRKLISQQAENKILKAQAEVEQQAQMSSLMDQL